MAQVTGIKIAPETAASARILLGQRAAAQAALERAGSGTYNGQEQAMSSHAAGQLAGAEAALAALWQAVLEHHSVPS